ncbi:MAG: hypothetical protein AABX46_02000 [Thermoproteota archaeon]
MSKIGVGEIISELRKKIQDIQFELNELGGPVLDMPELITSANLLRSNEYLTKVSEKQSELLSAYGLYSKALEDIITVVFDIQNDLKNLLKEQSKLISVRKSPRSSISKNKKKSTTKRKSLKK